VRRVALLSVPLVLLMGVAAAVIAVEAGRPREWQLELNSYLRDQPGAGSVQATDWAGHPEAFGPDMSRTASESPFTPEAVWCVLIKRSRGAELPYQVVFVNHYVDPPWYDEWVVHEGRGNPFAPIFLDGLGRLGCDLGLGDMGPGDIRPVVRRLP
jgi:hypothetical protein